jgi:hypothetical protein
VRAALAVIAVALGAGCAADRGLVLDLTVAPDCFDLDGVAHINITFEATPPLRLDSGGTVFTRPPEWLTSGDGELVLLLPEATRSLAVQVQLVDGAETPLATGSKTFTFTGPGRVAGTLPLHLDDCPLRVDGGADLSSAEADLAVPDAGTDLSVVPDLSSFDAAQDGSVVAAAACASAHFDGVSGQVIKAPHVAAYNPSGSVSIEAWVFPTAAATGARRYIAGHGSATMPSYALWLDGTNIPMFCFSTSGGAERCISGFLPLQVGFWAHLVGEVATDLHSGVLFVNGANRGSLATDGAGGLTAVNLPLAIGNSPDDDAPFTGYIDEVRVSSVVRYFNPMFTLPRRFDPDADTLALFHLDESGAPPLDSSWNGNNAIAYGALSTNSMCVFTRCGSVFLYGGEVDAPPIAAHNPSIFTIEAWVRPNMSSSNDVNIVGRWGSISSGNGSYMLYLSNGQLSFAFTCDGRTVRQLVAGNVIIPLNIWTHVAGTFDSAQNRLTLFANGFQVAQQPMSAIPCDHPYRPDGGVPFTVGYHDVDGGDSMQGYVDEVRLSSVLRYTGPYAPAQTFVSDGDTLALYHFDEASGSTAADSSPSHNTAMLINNAVFNTSCF